MSATTMSSVRIAPVSQVARASASKAVRAMSTRSSFQGKAMTVSFARKQIISSRVMKIRASEVTGENISKAIDDAKDACEGG